MPEAPGSVPLPRRRLLLGLALPAALALGGLRPGLAAAARAPERRLLLHHRHTGEWFRAAYYADGAYLPQSLREIRRILRDWRTDETVDFDPRLLDIAHLLQQRLGRSAPFEVICGYRSPATNAMLRRKSRAVAKDSLHMYGMALDIRFEGPALRAAHRMALALGAGGVGYYPRDGFIHLDSGPVRQWGQGGTAVARKAARQKRSA
jgi:uncharacterized protein YcbK (DUF882 family)